jgi:phosphoesterase RecJ-like protein
MSIKKIIESIKQNNTFLVTSHMNLEGDALGSELAFAGLIRKIGKKAVIVNEDNTPEPYDFLPGVKKIKKHKHNMDLSFDCMVFLDCSGLHRCGEVYKINTGNKPTINIDHHISNEKFAGINWVDPSSSCCCQMIYQLYKKMRIKLDMDIATCLYAGILTDTGSFRYTNTSALTHRIVSELVGYGLDVSAIYKKIYGSMAFQDMKLLGRILPRISCDQGGKIAWAQINKSDLRHKHIGIDLGEHILGFMRLIRDVEVAVLFKENLKDRHEVRVNLRSQGKADVNKIASLFGGGGHKTASGCTIKGDIDKVKAAVLRKIKESIY